MASIDDFYAFRTTMRGLFGAYVASESTAISKLGSRNKRMKLRLLKLLWFSAAMDVIESFDPTTQSHMFNAREMREFETLLNELNNTHYIVNWAAFYTDEALNEIGIWYDEDHGGIWYDEQSGGIWYDNP